MMNNWLPQKAERAEWTMLGPFILSAAEIEEAMRQEFWGRYGRGHDNTTDSRLDVVVEWREGERGQPEIAAGWSGYGVKQLPGSARDVFWLALEILEGRMNFPAGIHPDEEQSRVSEDHEVQLMIHAKSQGRPQMKSEVVEAVAKAKCKYLLLAAAIMRECSEPGMAGDIDQVRYCLAAESLRRVKGESEDE